ncbi:DNA helicase PSH3, putative [Plasmodium vivax]|uniref:DNA helicase PSH3, putative n=1 Tax=Plasmodium vivax TaxID=5855 RepID=A0A564ZN82_PLAVI|nr:DNA helicase PSH3, putative [Plasmodium vivax]
MNPWAVPIGHLNDLLAEAPEEEKNEKNQFEELDMPREVIEALGRMGIRHPSTIQQLSVGKALRKRSLIVQAKNGTGKSMSVCMVVASRIVATVKRRHVKKRLKRAGERGAYGEAAHGEAAFGADPAVSLFLHSVILVPTRELCVQLRDNIREISNQGIFINWRGDWRGDCRSGELPRACDNVRSSSPNVLPSDHRDAAKGEQQIGRSYSPFEVKPMVLYGGTDVLDDLQMLFACLPHVVISTPGRLKHVLSILSRLHVSVGRREAEGCPTKVPLTKIVNVLVKQLILDEVDALLDEQFESQMKVILSQVVSPKVQVLCYSSTCFESSISRFVKVVNLHDVGYLSRWKGFCVKRMHQILGGNLGGGLPPGEVPPELKVRSALDQDTPPQSNHSGEGKLAEEETPLEVYLNREVSSPPDSPQNNRAHTKVKKKKKKKKKKNLRRNKQKGMNSIEEMVQAQSVFQEESSVRYILRKIVKEKGKVALRARRRREFEFVQTCTSVIVHGEGGGAAEGGVDGACDGKEVGDKGGSDNSHRSDNHTSDGEIPPLYCPPPSALSSPVLRNVRHCFITVDNERLSKHEELKYKMKVILKVVREIKFHLCFLFINSTYEGVQVSKMLKKHGVCCYYTSSKVEHQRRMQVFNNLRRNEVKVVVCSDVMSRGIDNIACDLVINLDIPQSKETYIHRSGRCGRYGNRGLCISLCNYSDYAYLHFYKYQLRLPVHDFCFLRREQRERLEERTYPHGDAGSGRGKEGEAATWEEATQEEPTCEVATKEAIREETPPGEHSTSCVETHLGVHAVEQPERKAPPQQSRLGRGPRKKALALNIKGFCAEGIHIAGGGTHVSSQVRREVSSQVKSEVSSQVKSEVSTQVKSEVSTQVKSEVSSQVKNAAKSEAKSEPFPPHRGVHLNVRVKNFVSKFKVARNEVCCEFCLPNDNANVFQSISVIQHKSSLIIFFLFSRRIRMRLLSFRALQLAGGEEAAESAEKGSKCCRSHYCLLFFCNSDSYLVLKVFYFFLFLFKHYQYPLREALTPLLIHTGGSTPKGGKWKKRCDRCCHAFRPNRVNLNYVSDTCLMIGNNIQRAEKKKKKNFKGCQSDEDFYMNRQGKTVTTFRKAMFYPFLLGSQTGHCSSGQLSSPGAAQGEQAHRGLDYEILQRREGELQPSSLPLESALNQIKATPLERKQIASLSQQCSEYLCMNDQREVAQKVNMLVAPQVFLNLAEGEEDVHLLKGLFLQSHVQLHGGAGQPSGEKKKKKIEAEVEA